MIPMGEFSSLGSWTMSLAECNQQWQTLLLNCSRTMTVYCTLSVQCNSSFGLEIICGRMCYSLNRLPPCIGHTIGCQTTDRLLRSAADRTLLFHIHTTTWCPEFRCCRSAGVEQSILSQLWQDINYTDNSNDNWKHFCSWLTDHGASWLLICALEILLLAYLLTYLLVCLLTCVYFAKTETL